MRNKQIVFGLFVLAITVRVIFYFFGTPYYYGESGYIVSSDTSGWLTSITNLVEKGIYTADESSPQGYFYRPPGYGFFLLPFYLLTDSWNEAFPYIAFFQIFLDSIVVVLFYDIVRSLTKSKIYGAVGGLAYCFYVFALGWTPVLYPEAPANFFLVLGVWFLVKGMKEKRKGYWFLFGMTWGIAVLLRIQLLTILPAPMILVLYWVTKKDYTQLKFLPLYLLGVALTYGIWPARNLINHGKLVITQELIVGGVWSDDYMSFTSFVYSVKTDYQPQLNQLLKKEQLEWPETANFDAYDSLKISEAINLMHLCGRGTQAWKKSKDIGEPTAIEIHCDKKIESIWNELIERQKVKNPLHYWVKVPLSNLSKAIFKLNLHGQATPIIVKVAFILRSILILLGVLSSIVLLIYGNKQTVMLSAIILASFILLYFSLSIFHRNIEVRYFLPVDLLLLMPTVIGLSKATGNAYRFQRNKWKQTDKSP